MARSDDSLIVLLLLAGLAWLFGPRLLAQLRAGGSAYTPRDPYYSQPAGPAYPYTPRDLFYTEAAGPYLSDGRYYTGDPSGS